MGLALAAPGILIILAAIGARALKKMTADLTAAWGILGMMMIIAGAALSLSGRVDEVLSQIEYGTAAVVAAGFLACFQFSLITSRLIVKNRELAIEVSLLQGDGKIPDESEKRIRKELLVIIPAHNEEQNIQKVLEQLEQQEILNIADILVIDDASSDATGRIVRGHACTLITNIFWLGYGNALQLGYKYAVREHYRYVIQMDADGQHDVCNIHGIYQKLQEKDTKGRRPDIVLGSRFMEGSSAFQVIWLKKFAYALFRLMILAVTGERVADPTTGLQGLSGRAFLYYSKTGNFDDRYPDANMVLQMLLLKFHVVQIPAVMHARVEGQSMHGGVKEAWYMCRMLFDIPAIIFRIKGLKTDAAAETDS